MTHDDITPFLIDDEEAQALRSEAEAYPDNVKLVPMALAKRDGKIGVATAFSCLCVTDPDSEDYGMLDMSERNPLAIWECDPSSAFPGTRKNVRRSWAPVHIKSDISEQFRNYVNGVLKRTAWANGRDDKVKDVNEQASEEAVEEALSNVETE